MAEILRLPDVAMAAIRARGAAAQGLPRVGGSVLRDGDTILAIGPDEWLAIAPDGDADTLQRRLGGGGVTVVDVSGNRVRYRVSGDDARWLLSAGCGFDLERLKPGDAISTTLARMQALIVTESADSYIVMPRRSFATYFERWAAAANC